MDISRIRIMDTVFEGDATGSTERVWRRRLFVHHLPARVKRGEVKRHIGSKIFHNPLGEGFKLLFGIVFFWDEQGRDFQPDVGLMFEILQRVQNGLKV